ncbi:MAG: ATP-binding cassette domain-containing protein [Alphaproteobacteria bacterium]|nr:ATP-binding cassette domain-containing protein [Alphaproteobacteria bacterium]
MPVSDPSLPRADLRLLLPLLAYLRPYRLRVALAGASILFTSAAVLGMGASLRYMVDYGLNGTDTRLLDRGFLLMWGVIALLALASYGRYYLVAWLGERVVADIRQAIYAQLLRMDVTFFETTPTGELLSRLTTDTTLLQSVIGSTIAIALRNTLLLAGGLGLLLATSPRLTFFVLMMLPLVVIPILVLGRRVRGLSRETQAKVATLNAHAEETISAIRTVHAMTLEQQAQARFAGTVDTALATALARIRLRAFLIALVISLVFGAVVTVLWIGGHGVAAGRMSAGNLSAFVFYAVVVAGAVGALSEVGGELQRAAGAAERLSEMLKLVPRIQSPPYAVPLPLTHATAAALDFSHVTFHYPSRRDRHALHDISFRVAAGEAVAVVGPSGAGKSTLFQLILRFYDPTSGTIRINGAALPDVELASLRRHIALVPQEPVIFSGDAWENIRVGRPNASNAEIMAAADAAYALEFLEKLPQGLSTHLGEKGVRLSGGQKQRLAIARAVIRNPHLLLLDEATSALDAASEQLVRQALAELMRGRTTLIIAHRLSTVINADRILLLNEGRIEAEGPHPRLLRESPLYARLAALHWEHAPHA